MIKNIEILQSLTVVETQTVKNTYIDEINKEYQKAVDEIEKLYSNKSNFNIAMFYGKDSF